MVNLLGDVSMLGFKGRRHRLLMLLFCRKILLRSKCILFGCGSSSLKRLQAAAFMKYSAQCGTVDGDNDVLIK